MNTPLVTLLMPTHSRVDVIGYAIRSILAQTMSDFELLVVGDGCAEGTREVVESFQDARVRFFDLPKAPYYGYANRNIVLHEAKGKYISYPSDDDLMLPDHLENLVNAMDSGAIFAHSSALWISTDGIIAPFSTDLTIESHRARFMRGNSLCAGSIMYRADALERIDAWPEDVPSAADWILWKRILSENPSGDLVYIPVPSYLHFSALWKNSRHSGMPQMLRQLEIADYADWWPEELRLHVPHGMSEQEVFAFAISEEPYNFSWRLRNGVTKLNSRLAWDAIETGGPAFAQLKTSSQRRISELEGRIDQLTKDYAVVLSEQQALLAHKDELDKIKQTNLWKLSVNAEKVLRIMQGKLKL